MGPKEKTKVICFIGIDGSGKSTLIQKINRDLIDSGNAVQVIHMYHQPFILSPIKWIARVVFLKKKKQHDGDYESYRSQKHRSSGAHPFLAAVYAFVWLCDYALQCLWKYYLPYKIKKPDIMVLDRYIYDTAINIILSLDLPERKLSEIIDHWHKLFPIPSLIFWIDVPVDVAYKRKDDIPSIEYLRERILLYEKYSGGFKSIRLDGCLPVEEICIQIKGYMKGKQLL